MELLTGELTAQSILLYSDAQHASDIHLAPGCALMIRIDGGLYPVSDHLLTEEETARITRSMITEKQWQELEETGELDFAYSFPGFTRVRVNAFRQRGSYALAMRILAFNIPTPQTLGIPKSVVELSDRKRGLVLVTGATGSGKSTTLASLLQEISNKYAKHIITMEDPIEYIHHHNKSIVDQREVGSDTMSYANAVRAALREDPDVILIGEMRDLETISTAITAAETGHLVFSTLHTNSAADAVDRVIDVFPPHQQPQIRIQFAAVIEGIIAQQLIPQIDGGRVAAFEVMLGSPAIRNLVREGKAFQIPSIIQTSKKEGMQLMDDHLYDLALTNFITREDAIRFSHDHNAMAHKTAMLG